MQPMAIPTSKVQFLFSSLEDWNFFDLFIYVLQSNLYPTHLIHFHNENSCSQTFFCPTLISSLPTRRQSKAKFETLHFLIQRCSMLLRRQLLVEYEGKTPFQYVFGSNVFLFRCSLFFLLTLSQEDLLQNLLPQPQSRKAFNRGKIS